ADLLEQWEKEEDRTDRQPLIEMITYDINHTIESKLWDAIELLPYQLLMESLMDISAGIVHVETDANGRVLSRQPITNNFKQILGIKNQKEAAKFTERLFSARVKKSLSVRAPHRPSKWTQKTLEAALRKAAEQIKREEIRT